MRGNGRNEGTLYDTACHCLIFVVAAVTMGFAIAISSQINEHKENQVHFVGTPNVPSAVAASPDTPLTQVVNFGEAICGSCKTYPLIAENTLTVGTVTVCNSHGTTYVTYRTPLNTNQTLQWFISEISVHAGCSVGDIPMNEEGMPVSAKFNYVETFNPPLAVWTVEFPNKAWENCAKKDDGKKKGHGEKKDVRDDDHDEHNCETVIAAQAVVTKLFPGSNVQVDERAAWAKTKNFDTCIWASYACYDPRKCKPFCHKDDDKKKDKDDDRDDREEHEHGHKNTKGHGHEDVVAKQAVEVENKV